MGWLIYLSGACVCLGGGGVSFSSGGAGWEPCQAGCLCGWGKQSDLDPWRLTLKLGSQEEGRGGGGGEVGRCGRTQRPSWPQLQGRQGEESVAGAIRCLLSALLRCVLSLPPALASRLPVAIFDTSFLDLCFHSCFICPLLSPSMGLGTLSCLTDPDLIRKGSPYPPMEVLPPFCPAPTPIPLPSPAVQCLSHL